MYKRQDVDNAEKEHQLGALHYKGQRRNDAAEEHAAGAVSYTHLDVYKRQVLAAATPGYGGVAEALFKMCVGNHVGLQLSNDIDLNDLFKPAYGAVILEPVSYTHLRPVRFWMPTRSTSSCRSPCASPSKPGFFST